MSADVTQPGLITSARRRGLALLTLSICDLGGFFPFFTAVDSVLQAAQLVAFAFRVESDLFAKWPDVRAAFTALQLPAGLLQSAAGLWIGSVAATLLCFASCTALVVRRSNVDESKLLLFPTRFIAGSGLVPVLSGLLLPLAAQDSASGQESATAISWCTYSPSRIGHLEAWLCDKAEDTQGGAVALGVVLGLVVLTLATLQTFVGHLPALYAVAISGQTEQQAARSLSSGGLLSYFPGLSWTSDWREGSAYTARQGGANGYTPVSISGASVPHSASGIDESVGLGARTGTALLHGNVSVATAVAAPHMLVVKSVELAVLVFVHCLGESGALPVGFVGAVTGIVAFFVVLQSVLYQPYAGLVLNQVHSASGMLTLWTLFCHSLAAGPLGASRAAMVWAITAPVAFLAGAEFVTLSRQVEASIVMKRTRPLPSLATPLAFALRIDAQARSALALYSSEPDTFAAVNYHYMRAIRARNPSSLLYTLYSHFLAFKGDMLGALTQLEVAEALVTREADELYLSLTRYRYTLGSTPILGESETASVSDDWGSVGVHRGTWHIHAASRLGGKSSNNATVLQALRELSSEEARTAAFKFAFDAQTLMADMWTSLTGSKVQTTELLAIADSLDTALQEADAAFRLAESLQPGHVATLREHAAFLLDSTCDHFAAAKLLEAADEAEDRASKRRIKVEAGPYVYQGPEPSFDAGAWATLGGGLGDAVGVLLVGLDQVIRKASAGACLLFGYTKGDVEGKHLAAFMPADLAVLMDAQNKSSASTRSASLIGGDGGAGGAVGQTGMVSSMAQHREGHIFTTANQFTITPQGLALVFVNRPTKEYHFILKPPADFPQTFGRTMGRFLAHAWLALPPTGYMVTAADKGTMHALGVTASDVQMYNVAFEQYCPEIPDLCRDAVSRFFSALTNTADASGVAGVSAQQPLEGASPSRRLQTSITPVRSPPGPSVTSRRPSIAAMAAGVDDSRVPGRGNRHASVTFDLPLGAEVVRLVNLSHSATPAGVALATMRLQYVCVPALLRDIPGVFIVSWRILDGPQEYAVSNSGMPDAEASELPAAESSVSPTVKASNPSLEPSHIDPMQRPARAPEQQPSRQAISNVYLRSPSASRDATVGRFSSLPGGASSQSRETQAGAAPASDLHEAVGLNDSDAEHVDSTGLSSASEGQNDANRDSQVRVSPVLSPAQTSAEPAKPLQPVSAPVVGTPSFLARPSFFGNESNRVGLPFPVVQEEKPRLPVGRVTIARSSVNSSMLALDGLPGWSSEARGQGQIMAEGMLATDAPPMPLLIPPPVMSASIIDESPVNHPRPKSSGEDDAGAASAGVSPRRRSNVNFADAKNDADGRRGVFASPLASPHTGMHHGHDDRMSKISGDDTGSAASFNSARAANALRAHIEARRKTLDPSLHAVRVWLLGVVLLVCAALLAATGTVWVFSTEAEDALQRAYECQLVRTAVLEVSAAMHSIILLAAAGVGTPVHLLNRMSMPYVQALQAEAVSSGRMAAPSTAGGTNGVQGIAVDSTGHMQPVWGSLTHSQQRSVVGNATVTLLLQTSDVLSVWVTGLVGASLPLSRSSQGDYVEAGSDVAHVLRHMHSVSSIDTVPLSVTALDMGVGLTAAEAGLAYGPASGFVSVTGRVGVPSEIRREVRLPAAALEMTLALRAVARAVESLGLPAGLSTLPSLTSKAECQYVMRNLEPSFLVALGKLQGEELQHAGRSINNAYLSNFLLILCVLCLTDVVLVTGLVPLTHSVHSATVNTVRLLLLLPRPTLKALAGRSKKSKARLTEMMRISLDLREAGDGSDEEGGGGGGDMPAWAEGQRAHGGATSPHAGPIALPKDPDAIDLDAGGISMFYQQRSGKNGLETSPKAVGRPGATAHLASESFLISPNAGMPSPRWNSHQNHSPRKLTPHQVHKHAEQQARLMSAYPLFLKLMTAFSLPQLVVMALVSVYWLWVTLLLTPLVHTATLVAVQQERAVTASRLVASALVAVVLSSSGGVRQGDAYNATEALVRHLADAVESQSYILQEGSQELGFSSTASLDAAVAELESSSACKVFHSSLPEASGTWNTASRSTPDLPASSSPYRTTVLSWFWSSPQSSRVFRYIDYMSRGQLPWPEGLGEPPPAAIVTANTATVPLSVTQSSPILDASGAVPRGLYAHACGRVVDGILTRGIGPATDLLVQYGREAVERSTLQQRSQTTLNCTLPGPYLAGLLQAGGRSSAEVQSVLTAPVPLSGDAGTDYDCAGSVRRRLAAEASFLEPILALDRTVLRYVLHAPTAGIAVKLHHWLYEVRVAYTVCTVGTILLLIIFHHRAYSYVLQYVNEKLLHVRALLLLIPQEQVKRFPALQAGIGQVTKGIQTAHWLTSNALERTKPHHQLHDHSRARRSSAVGMLSPGTSSTKGALISPSATGRALPRW